MKINSSNSFNFWIFKKINQHMKVAKLQKIHTWAFFIIKLHVYFISFHYYIYNSFVNKNILDKKITTRLQNTQCIRTEIVRDNTRNALFFMHGIHLYNLPSRRIEAWRILSRYLNADLYASNERCKWIVKLQVCFWNFETF